MSNVNSFTETVNLLVEQVNIALENVVKLNESITTQEDTVVLSVEQTDPITGDASTVSYSIPSYNTVINKVNALSQTMDTFVKGEGVVLLNDGTYRSVTTIPVAIAPAQILDVAAPTKFSTKTNWFFEDMIFPKLVVSFDLKNKIDDRSDRVVVRRVIFDNPSEEETQWFLDNIVGIDRTYYDTITYLETQNKKYWEDDEVLDLPLYAEPYTGSFIIMDKQTITAKEWYYLDTLKYGVTSDSPVVKDHQLAIGDQLRYNNSIWKIDDIQVDEKRVHLIPMVGMDHPTINNSFQIYTTPFSTKILEIGVGYDECQILFLKGVNDDFNIIGDDWSYGISFYSNNLILSEGSITLENYYNNYVSDFGRQMEGQAKEKFIPAFFGEIPDAPILSAADFQVKQINTQLNAALDTTAIKNTQTQIESDKTLINSLKTTIANQKSQLISLTDAGLRASLQSQIDNNQNSLAKLTTEYNSLVKSLYTLAYENSAVLVDPKYRARGFFSIPAAKGTPPQQIIQFEQAYRYLKLDNTGVALDTYTHTDPSTGQVVKGVFSDWIIVQSSIKKRQFNSSTNTYEWIDENISDGEEVNINQIDIPIQKGEKIELKIRSISEAGWPTNPVKSAWSSPIIIEFPANLQGSDQVQNILSDATIEQSTIQLDQTIASSGITSHIADSFPNPNSGTGTYFKHQAVNLSYDLKVKSVDNIVSSISTTDMQTQFDNLANNVYITLTRPSGSGSGYSQATGTLQQFCQAVVEASANIYDKFVNIIIV